MKKNVIASDRRERGNLIGKIVIASVARQSQPFLWDCFAHAGLAMTSEGIFLVPRNDKCNCAPRKEGVKK